MYRITGRPRRPLSRRPVVDVDYTPERAEHITLDNDHYDFLPGKHALFFEVSMLEQAGVRYARGFALNTSEYDATGAEIDRRRLRSSRPTSTVSCTPQHGSTSRCSQLLKSTSPVNLG